MSDFKAKMHQIVCRLGRPRWGSLQPFPRLPSWILGGLLLRGGKGERGSDGRGGEGRAEKGKGREEGVRVGPQAKAWPPKTTFLAPALAKNKLDFANSVYFSDPVQCVISNVYRIPFS